MRSERTVYFSYVVDSSEELLYAAATAAEQYENYTIIGHCQDMLNLYKEYIKENCKDNADILFLLLDKKIFPNTVRDFIYELDELNSQVIYEVNLNDYSIITSTHLKKYINEIPFDDLVLHGTAKDLDEVVNSIPTSEVIASSLKNVISFSINIKREINRFFDGDSFLSKDVNFKKRYNSDFQNLSLSEYEALITTLKKYSKSEYGSFNKELMNKIRELSVFLNIVPKKSEDVNSLTERNNYNHDGFPSIYKFISSLHFECALHSSKMNNSILCFLHAIRAMETYIDGFLIYSKKAKIDRFYDKKNSRYIEDTFMLNGSTVNGISAKLDEVCNIEGFSNSPVFQGIKDMVKIRNKVLLTHGDIKVCNILSRQSVDDVFKFIKLIEPKGQKNGFEWAIVREKIHSILSLDLPDLVFNSLFVKFNK